MHRARVLGTQGEPAPSALTLRRHCLQRYPRTQRMHTEIGSEICSVVLLAPCLRDGAREIGPPALPILPAAKGVLQRKW